MQAILYAEGVMIELEGGNLFERGQIVVRQMIRDSR